MVELNHRLAMQMQLEEADEDAYSSEHSSDYKDKVEYASDSPNQSATDDQTGTEVQIKFKRRKKQRDEELTE